MPYSLEEFIQDMAIMPEVNTSEWDVVPGRIPEHGDHFEYAPKVKPMMRRINYFVDRYGHERGADNSFRFFIIATFFSLHRAKLLKLGLVKRSEEGDVISTTLVQFLLGGFVEPKPPVLFPRHQFFNRQKVLSFKKVMQHFVQVTEPPFEN